MQSTQNTTEAKGGDDKSSLKSTDLITTRDWEPETDKNFIFATMLKGLYYGNEWFREIEKDTFMKHYHKIIETLLNYPGVTITVACLKEDKDVILGYSVSHWLQTSSTTGLNVLDFVFVKDRWRRIGIAKTLVPKDYEAVSHLTKQGKALKPKNIPFNPFLL